MKATNLILIVAFLSFATMGFSQDRVDPGPLTIEITLKAALERQNLVTIMYQQLNPGEVLNQNPGELPRLITVKVKARKVVYVITGTLEEWTKFFKKRLVEKPKM